jgi:hypothetical protein
LLTSNGKTVLRKDVYKTLTDKGAKQTILITDSCAETSGPRPQLVAPGAIPTYPLYYLLFDLTATGASGQLNVNGASPSNANTETGWYILDGSDGGGGVFTRSFMTEAIFGQRTRSWNDFLSHVSQTTQKEAARIGKAQVPSLIGANGVYLKDL